ncbi:hypothetical protein GCM10009682_15380 [Luedemannella flava]|uniref:Secreted protein n=1 Tax=Luedemannella flava TaxID=349316 RepID=A0ABP4XWX2_9ACTN
MMGQLLIVATVITTSRLLTIAAIWVNGHFRRRHMADVLAFRLAISELVIEAERNARTTCAVDGTAEEKGSSARG